MGESCEFAPGERVSVFDPRLDNPACVFLPGSSITVPYVTGREPHDTEKRTMPSPVPSASSPVVAASSFPMPLPTATATPAAPVATVSVEPASPTSAAGELGKLVPTNGQISGLTIALAAVAVLGGGAAWKFYSQHSKEKHEERMKRLEIEANRPETPEQHPSCKSQAADASAQATAFKARLDALEERLAAVEKKLDAVREGALAGPSTSDLDERVTKLEAVRAAAKPALKRGAKR